MRCFLCGISVLWFSSRELQLSYTERRVSAKMPQKEMGDLVGETLNMGWLLVTPPLLFLDSVFQFSLLSVSVLQVFTFALKKRRQLDFHS